VDLGRPHPRHAPPSDNTAIARIEGLATAIITTFAMLDLKSKLAAAGLVTQADVDRVEKTKGKTKSKRRGGRRGSGRGDQGRASLSVATLRDKGKGEQYDAVRRFIAEVRLDDPARPPGEEAKAFHFSTAQGRIGRMILEPEVLGWVREGGAGIVAFMSNHGLAHAAVPAKAARLLAELIPLWLRVLEGHPGAGQIEAPPPEADADEASEVLVDGSEPR